MEVIIRGWEEKFERISRCLREVQSASERANSDMCNISREARAQGDEQERRLEAMHAGITEFLQKCDSAHLPTTHNVDAPMASTPYTPTGIPATTIENHSTNDLHTRMTGETAVTYSGIHIILE